MNRYRKLFVAAVGMLAMVLGADTVGLEQQASVGFDAAVALLTAFGVWAVPNAPKNTKVL